MLSAISPDGQPLVEDQKKPSALFRQMADRIEHNEATAFGGAMVISPPGEHSQAISVLILDPGQDELHFWLALQTKVQAAVAALSEVQRGQNAFRR